MAKCREGIGGGETHKLDIKARGETFVKAKHALAAAAIDWLNGEGIQGQKPRLLICC